MNKISLQIVSLNCRFFSTSIPACSKRSALRKPNISTLTKHLKPDGLNGRERRDLLRDKLKSSKGTGNGPYIPVKRRLETIPTKTKQLSAFLATQRFEDLALNTHVVEAIQGVLPEDAKPTEIQALAIPQLLDRRKQHILIAAETGSGKTFAYLLPTIEMLKADEKAIGRRPNRPRAIVLVPTRELIDQVVKSAKSLSHTVKFRAIGLDRKPSRKQAQLFDDSPVDLLVTTPTSLVASVKQGLLSLADARYLVIDEADSMFDAGWGDDCRWIIERFRDGKITVVSATLPKSVHKALDDLFPRMIKITTPSLHKSLPNLKQSFVDLDRFQGNRQLALLEVLKKNLKDRKTLIFCNTKKSVELLYKFLESKQLKSLALYKDAPMDRRETLALFSTSQETDHRLLISTDIASRGIDVRCVDHVILFDFPASAIDYLHRVGRTARAGDTGKATCLIGRKDRMMADRIKRSIREGSILT